jgi:TetR/AcrR family transcriptional regulator
VNKQLISCYFGGKHDLYRALGDRWRAGEAAIAGPELPLDVTIRRFLAATSEQPLSGRLLAWEGLEGGEDPDAPERTARMQEAVPDLRRRQAAGELAADLDPASVLLAFFAAALALVAFPRWSGASPGWTLPPRSSWATTATSSAASSAPCEPL